MTAFRGGSGRFWRRRGIATLEGPAEGAALGKDMLSKEYVTVCFTPCHQHVATAEESIVACESYVGRSMQPGGSTDVEYGTRITLLRMYAIASNGVSNVGMVGSFGVSWDVMVTKALRRVDRRGAIAHQQN